MAGTKWTGGGYGDAKELTCMTHGHELSGGTDRGNGGNGGGVKREKLGHCNSKISKIYLKKHSEAKSALTY